MEAPAPDPPDVPLSDQEFHSLIEQAQHGDEAAIATICRYYEPIVRVAARFRLGPALRPHFDSVDLVQSVHKSLIVGLRDGKFDISSPKKLVALANVMVQRKIGRKWRKASRQSRLSGSQTDTGSVEDGLQALIGVEYQHSVDLRDQIAELCKRLSAEESKMLELRMAGLTSNEIALQMGLHPVAIRVRWTRLRKRLESIGITPEWFE